MFDSISYVATTGKGSAMTVKGSMLRRMIRDGADIASYRELTETEAEAKRKRDKEQTR